MTEHWCEVCACPSSQCLACDKCLTVQCWHNGPTDFVCENRRSAGLITQAEARWRAAMLPERPSASA